MSEENNQEFAPCWAILEIFGHARFAGLVGEQAIAGDKLLRLDIPAIPERRVTQTSRYHPTEGHSASNGSIWQYDMVFEPIPAETKLFGVKAIYAMTPTTEDSARFEVSRAASTGKRVENVVEIPDPRMLALPQPAPVGDDGDELEDEWSTDDSDRVEP